LGDLDGGSFYSYAYGVSGDGSVVVGNSAREGSNKAFRWTQAGGMVSLGDLSYGAYSSSASGASSDGSVIVGESVRASGGTEAFRWTEAGGMVGLGKLPGGGLQSFAYGVSGDGSVVVGRGTTASGADAAFIWDGVSGMRNLQWVLTNNYGLDLTGWTLQSAEAISQDGKAIAGYGTHNGYTEAWVASNESWVASIPEPSTSALLAAGLAGLMARRRRG
jgi:probable HAF family extracellular repeat protein